MSLSESLSNIAPNLIQFDKFNPRGETEDQIINDEDFHKLKESISKIGILVPLIVRKNEEKEPNSEKEYILIDGERRLRASLDLKLELVPVRLVNNDFEGRIIAYQVHQNRKAWSKPSEAKSIQSIIDSIKIREPKISETDLKKRLIEVTSHKPTAINDILKILKYDKDIQEKSARGEIDHSYLIRIEDDFITPLKRIYPQIIDTFGENQIRKIMITKAELKLLISTRYMMSSDFRKIFKPNLYQDQICALIKTFIQSPEESASDLYHYCLDIIKKEETKTSRNTPDSSNIIDTNSKENPIQPEIKTNSSNNVFTSQKEEKENNSASSENSNNKNEKMNNSAFRNSENTPIAINKAKKSDFNIIKEKLENAGEQYTEEELEYIKEAIVCLGSQKALKASILMIWASSISRILKFIEKDIPQFNKASQEMNSQKKSFYKFFANNFQTNATTIDDIREAARDMQLLCYICYKGIITKSQFKQLRGHYDTRNDCAHPTSIKLSLNAVLGIFDDLINSIFYNQKLK